MNTKQKLIRNTLFSGISKILMMAVGFFIMPYMINKLGKIEFGLISIANVFMVTGYIALFEMGFSGSITKYVAEYLERKEYEKISKLLSSTLILFFCIGLFLMLIGIAISNIIVTHFFKIMTVYQISLNRVLWVIFISYIFQFPNIILISFLQGMQRFDIMKSVQVLTFFLYALGIFILLQFGYNYAYIMVFQVLTLFFQFIVFIYYSFRLLPEIQFKFSFFSWDTIKQIKRMTGLLWIHRISSVLLNNTPRILISIFLGASAMTYYEASVKLPKLFKGLLGFINSTIIPAASEIQAANKLERLRKLFRKTTRYQFIFLVPLILTSGFLAKEFFVVWLGKEYVKLVPYFYLALVWAVITPFVTVGGAILVGMYRKLGTIVAFGILSMSLTFLISILLISKYQLIAVFYGMLGGSLLVLPFVLEIFIKQLKINVIDYFKEIFLIFLIGIIPLIIGMGLERLISFHSYLSLLIKSSLMIFIYWLVLYKVVLDSEDKIMIKKIIKRIK